MMGERGVGITHTTILRPDGVCGSHKEIAN
jgi:hypothetical protein